MAESIWAEIGPRASPPGRRGRGLSRDGAAQVPWSCLRICFATATFIS